MPPTYNVIFEAKLRGFYSMETAMRQLSEEFNLPAEKVQQLVENAMTNPVAIYKNISHEEAREITKRVENSGFHCNLAPDSLEIDKGVSVFERPTEVKKAEPKYWIVCHSCFLRQDDENDICEQCGVALHK